MMLNTHQIQHDLALLGGGAHALAIQILGNAEDAADAVHDALEKVLRAPGAYRPEQGPFKPWFLRVVRNRCIDLLRQRRPVDNRSDEIADAAADPAREAEIADRDRVLQLALASLDSDQRQIIVLRDYMDLTYAEIAAVLDTAPGTVMSRLHRARVNLGKAYREYDD
jgi:RNA polymerase sigma-70 factor (ECF subfamily)